MKDHCSTEGWDYQVTITGYLDEHRLKTLQESRVDRLPDGTTRISGITDQAALFGILYHIRDMGVELIAVTRSACNG